MWFKSRTLCDISILVYNLPHCLLEWFFSLVVKNRSKLIICCNFHHEINEVWKLRCDRNQEQRILCFKCNTTIRSEFNIKIETEKSTLFLISVSRIFSHEKSCYFVRWLSITNMMIMQTLKRCVGWITLSRMLRMLDNTKVQKSWIFFIFTSLMLYNTEKEKKLIFPVRN